MSSGANQKLISVWIYLISSLNFAQAPLIFSNDRFSGISAAPLSPTQPFLNPNTWDIHLFSENIFFQSDYIYISESSVIGLFSNDIESADISNGITGENTAHISDYYNKDITGYHFSSDLMGPSVSLKLNLLEKDFAVGFFSRLRTQSSTIDVDNYLQFTNQEIDEPILYDLSPFQTHFMNWNEIGLNLATELFPYSDYQWIVGVNLKYEMGLDAAYVKNREHAVMRRTSEPNFENQEENVKTLYISDFDMEIGYATNYNFDAERYEYNVRGKGFGADIGIAWLNPDEHGEGYDFKISLNALDIGYIDFNGDVHRFIGDDLKYTNNQVFDETEFENPEQYAQLISNEIYGNPDESHISGSFRIGLPTVVHLNLSKNIGENQFVNFDLIQRAPLFENSLKHANIAHVSYSFQKEGIGYGGSVSTYEYTNVQLGGFLRLGPLLIGSENILSLFFRQKKLHGLDFYIGLKIYPFWDNEMKRRNREDCKC